MSSLLGMLDWGVGGLGCYKLFKRARPDVPVLYVSDTGAVPYGKLTSGALRARVEQMLRWLIEQGASHLVVACNAASTVLPGIAPGVPTCGVIEHGLSAVPGSLQGVLGVLGGARTIRSGLYQRGLTRPGLTVRGRIAQPLSAHVESGTNQGPQFERDLAQIMAPLREVDALLLACTHYPAIASQLQPHAPGALIIDPASTLAATICARWQLSGPPSSTRLPEADRFVSTGDCLAMRSAAERVFGVQVADCQPLHLTKDAPSRVQDARRRRR